MNEEIKRKVEFHKLYLKDPEKYKEYRADFSGVDLCNERFVSENLSGANFSGCCISRSTFTDCNLSNCDFSNIYSDNDTEIHIILFINNGLYEDIPTALFHRMIICNSAKIPYGSISRNIGGIPYACTLNTIKNIKFSFLFKNAEKTYHSICPESGAFIGYKKAVIFIPKENQLFNMLNKYNCNIYINRVPLLVIVVLKIPEDAKRINPYLSNKCRCDKAEVVDIHIIGHDDLSIDIDHLTVASFYYRDKRLIYKIGEIVYADSFDDNKAIECSHGIHFFMTEKEAIDY